MIEDQRGLRCQYCSDSANEPAEPDDSGPALLKGTLAFVEEDGVHYQVMSGLWLFSGDAAPNRKQSFQLSRIVPPIEEPAVSDGEFEFSGSFNYDEQEGVDETGVKVVFQRRGKGSCRLCGRGQNEMGVFKFDGVATQGAMDETTYSIELHKRYILEMGALVSKEFVDERDGLVKPFKGSVASYNAERDSFLVEYEDGDSEELCEDDVLDIALPDGEEPQDDEAHSDQDESKANHSDTQPNAEDARGSRSG